MSSSTSSYSLLYTQQVYINIFFSFRTAEHRAYKINGKTFQFKRAEYLPATIVQINLF